MGFINSQAGKRARGLERASSARFRGCAAQVKAGQGERRSQRTPLSRMMAGPCSSPDHVGECWSVCLLFGLVKGGRSFQVSVEPLPIEWPNPGEQPAEPRRFVSISLGILSGSAS